MDSGRGARLAMFSARFNAKNKEPCNAMTVISVFFEFLPKILFDDMHLEELFPRVFKQPTGHTSTLLIVDQLRTPK